MSTNVPLASIIIDNYNYGRFLKDAIDSALAQTYCNTEVIVVDDGSTDNSREIIASFGDRIVPVLKTNGGQGSALNAGFKASRGEIVLFLDSDDMLYRTAVERALPYLTLKRFVKVHWPLWVVDQVGQKTGQMFPAGTLPSGDLTALVQQEGLTNVLSPVIAGAWARNVLAHILPMPEQIFRIGADTYLLELAPFLGPIWTIPEPQGFYRQHDHNFHNKVTIDYKLDLEILFFDCLSEVARELCRTRGVTIDVDSWKRKSWWHRQKQAMEDIARLPDTGGSLIVVDDGTWEVGPIAGRQRHSFLERDGEYWGPPSSNEEAVQELERLRSSGAAYLIFGWPAFWWLQHYSCFVDYLRSEYTCVLENDRLVIFDLGQSKN